MTEVLTDSPWVEAVASLAVARGERSAESVVEAHLEAIARANEAVNALVQVDAEGALEQARAVDERVAAGQRVGALAGVPVAVKDNIDVGGQMTAAGSGARSPVSAVRDAAVVTSLRAADAVILGRANMDELAMGASTQTSTFGPTRNPLDHRRSPGGSSGGSAAAVAAGMVPVALGTDTGGSIREPASQCGLVGLAPTPDTLPMRGILPFAPGFDTVGPIAHTVADAHLVAEVLFGRRLRSRPGARARIGVPRELCGPANQEGVLTCFDSARERLVDLGHDVRSVSLPTAPRALDAYSRRARCCARVRRSRRSGGPPPSRVRRVAAHPRSGRPPRGRVRAIASGRGGRSAAGLPHHADDRAAAVRRAQPRGADRPALPPLHRLLDRRDQPVRPARAVRPDGSLLRGLDADRTDAVRAGWRRG